jgi:hypothetical protein
MTATDAVPLGATPAGVAPPFGTAAPGGLTYRLLTDADVPAVLRLWEEAGWGTLTAEQWRSWYVDTPWGASIVAGLVDATGAVLGQIVLSPIGAELDGRPLRAMRVSAPILSHALRTPTVRRPNHPIPRLLSLAGAEARRQGVGLLYAVPEAAWLPVFAALRRHDDPILWFQTAAYPCRELRLADADARARCGALAGATRAEAIAEFDDEHAALWTAARAPLGVRCALARDVPTLRYKNGGHDAVAVRDPIGGALLGYVAVKRRSGLIVDAVAATPELLAPVLAAAACWLAARPPADADAPVTLKAMETSLLRPALDALGFTAVPAFTFAFACNGIDAGVPAEAVAPDRWFLMPGD